MKSQAEKFKLAQAIYDLIEQHGSEFGIYLNQDSEDMNAPELDVTFNKTKYTIECK